MLAFLKVDSSTCANSNKNCNSNNNCSYWCCRFCGRGSFGCCCFIGSGFLCASTIGIGSGARNRDTGECCSSFRDNGFNIYAGTCWVIRFVGIVFGRNARCRVRRIGVRCRRMVGSLAYPVISVVSLKSKYNFFIASFQLSIILITVSSMLRPHVFI